MYFKVKDDTGDVARAFVEVQAAFINMAFEGSPDATLRDVMDRQALINWNLLEVVIEEAEAKMPDPTKVKR